tara:strand:- start:857 stop:988 length:132 start_codon:yes stop_codon:yes gene_type:complete
MKEYVEAIKTLLKGVEDEDRYAILSIALDDINSDIYIDLEGRN